MSGALKLYRGVSSLSSPSLTSASSRNVTPGLCVVRTMRSKIGSTVARNGASDKGLKSRFRTRRAYSSRHLRMGSCCAAISKGSCEYRGDVVLVGGTVLLDNNLGVFAICVRIPPLACSRQTKKD